MNEVIMLHGDRLSGAIRAAHNLSMPIIISYAVDNCWHWLRAQITRIEVDIFEVKIVPFKKTVDLKIEPNQNIGVSFKHGYGVSHDSFLFDTKVLAVKTSSAVDGGFRLVLDAPKQMEKVQKRSYWRVAVPSDTDVTVEMWHRGKSNADPDKRTYLSGKLLDLSAGGLAVAIEPELEKTFKKRQLIGVRFVPFPHETELTFTVAIKSIMPTADAQSVCLGMQIAGLEASCQGRMVLQRICGVISQYEKMTQTKSLPK